MRLFSLDTSKITPRLQFFPLGREVILISGVSLLVMAFVAVVLWDIYLFYGTVAKAGSQGVVAVPKIEVSPQEIDEVIRSLDERKEKFNSLLRK